MYSYAGEMLNITTRGKEDRNGCWFAKKSINIDSNKQVFINYKGNCSSNDDLIGRYEVVFKDNETIGFFVAASPKVDRITARKIECASVNASTCLSLQRRSVNLEKCLGGKGGKAILEACDGEKVKDENAVHTHSKKTLDLLRECSGNVTVSCFVDGIGREVARVEVAVVDAKSEDGATSSDVVRNKERVSSTAGVVVGFVLVIILVLVLAAVTVKRGYFK